MGPHAMGWARSDQGESGANDNRNGVKAGATVRSGRKTVKGERLVRSGNGDELK